MRSTHAAETLALVECAGTAVFMKKVISQVANCNLLPIICYTDNKSLLDSVKSSKNADDKRLRIDLAVLSEMITQGEIKDTHSKSLRLKKRRPSSSHLRS